MQKHLLVASTAVGLMMAGVATAQPTITDVVLDGNSVANDTSVAFGDNNANADATSAAVANIGNGNDLSDDNSTADANNTIVEDVANDTDSGNVSDSLNLDVGLDAEVASSELDGTVTGNTASTLGGAVVTANNTVNGGAFSGVAGITQLSQNTGANALAQQSVSIKAKVELGGGM